MMNQFEYMKLRPIMESVFYDDMNAANLIIRAIQTYQEDDSFVPKVRYLPGEFGLNLPIIFTIDSAAMDVNYNAVHYDIELIAENIRIGSKNLREYKVKVAATCKLPDREPISLSGYSLITMDINDIVQFIEKSMFDKMLSDMLGNIALRIQRYCLKEAKSYIVTVNDENWRMCKEVEKYLTEPPKPVEFDKNKED